MTSVLGTIAAQLILLLEVHEIVDNEGEFLKRVYKSQGSWLYDTDDESRIEITNTDFFIYEDDRKIPIEFD